MLAADVQAWLSDPFLVFSTLLTLFVTAYYTLVTTMTVRETVRLLRGQDPGRRLLRLYLSYQLVTLRIRPLAGELLQIAVWLAILALIWRQMLRL
jgi:hypothetical protein